MTSRTRADGAVRQNRLAHRIANLTVQDLIDLNKLVSDLKASPDLGYCIKKMS